MELDESYSVDRVEDVDVVSMPMEVLADVVDDNGGRYLDYTYILWENVKEARSAVTPACEAARIIDVHLDSMSYRDASWYRAVDALCVHMNTVAKLVACYPGVRHSRFLENIHVGGPYLRSHVDYFMRQVEHTNLCIMDCCDHMSQVIQGSPERDNVFDLFDVDVFEAAITAMEWLCERLVGLADYVAPRVRWPYSDDHYQPATAEEHLNDSDVIEEGENSIDEAVPDLLDAIDNTPWILNDLCHDFGVDKVLERVNAVMAHDAIGMVYPDSGRDPRAVVHDMFRYIRDAFYVRDAGDRQPRAFGLTAALYYRCRDMLWAAKKAHKLLTRGSNSHARRLSDAISLVLPDDGIKEHRRQTLRWLSDSKRLQSRHDLEEFIEEYGSFIRHNADEFTRLCRRFATIREHLLAHLPASESANTCHDIITEVQSFGENLTEINVVEEGENSIEEAVPDLLEAIDNTPWILNDLAYDFGTSIVLRKAVMVVCDSILPLPENPGPMYQTILDITGGDGPELSQEANAAYNLYMVYYDALNDMMQSFQLAGQLGDINAFSESLNMMLPDLEQRITDIDDAINACMNLPTLSGFVATYGGAVRVVYDRLQLLTGRLTAIRRYLLPGQAASEDTEQYHSVLTEVQSFGENLTEINVVDMLRSDPGILGDLIEQEGGDFDDLMYVVITVLSDYTRRATRICKSAAIIRQFAVHYRDPAIARLAAAINSINRLAGAEPPMSVEFGDSGNYEMFTNNCSRIITWCSDTADNILARANGVYEYPPMSMDGPSFDDQADYRTCHRVARVTADMLSELAKDIGLIRDHLPQRVIWRRR